MTIKGYPRCEPKYIMARNGCLHRKYQACIRKSQQIVSNKVVRPSKRIGVRFVTICHHGGKIRQERKLTANRVSDYNWNRQPSENIGKCLVFQDFSFRITEITFVVHF